MQLGRGVGEERKKRAPGPFPKEHRSHQILDGFAVFRRCYYCLHSMAYPGGGTANLSPPLLQNPVATPAQNAVSPPLPAGWSAQITPDSGKVYYYEAATGKTQWEHPAGIVVAGVVDPTVGQEVVVVFEEAKLGIKLVDCMTATMGSVLVVSEPVAPTAQANGIKVGFVVSKIAGQSALGKLPVFITTKITRCVTCMQGLEQRVRQWPPLCRL